MSTHLSRSETLTLLSLTAACCGILANTFSGNSDGEPLIASLAFSGLAFAISFCLIRWLGPTFMKAGLKGRDLSKTKTSEMQVNSRRNPIAALLTQLRIDQRLWVHSVQLSIFSSSLSSYHSHSTKILLQRLLE